MNTACSRDMSRSVLHSVRVRCRFQTDGTPHEVVVSDGFAEIMPDYCILLVSSAERPDEIDRARAERAKERAEERLRQKQSIREYHLSKAALARAMARLKATR